MYEHSSGQRKMEIPLRIVELVQSLAHGGLEQMACLLAGQFARRGHEVTICCYDRIGPLGQIATENGVDVQICQRRQGLDWRFPLRLSRLLRKIRPNVLHMHNETAMCYGTMAGLVARVPILIYTEHDGVFPRSWLSRQINPLLVRRLTHAVAVSEAVRGLWCRMDSIPVHRVAVIPNGVPDLSLPQRPLSGGFVIGSVGRLSPEKGMDVLMEAFALVRSASVEARLVVIGDGSDRSSLEATARRLNIEGSVEMPGFRSDVAGFLSHFTVFVLASRSEGLPLAILEAMSAGLPVVASTVGGIPEAITHEENGLLVPPDDPQALSKAIIRLADDQDLRQRLGKAARATFLERYSLVHMVDQYEALMKG